jgi:hypothetical protein
MKNIVRKPDSKGNPLPEEIGKGIDKLQSEKALDVRKQMVGVLVKPSRKELFRLSCESLDLKQADIINLAIDETIKKANEI